MSRTRQEFPIERKTFPLAVEKIRLLKGNFAIGPSGAEEKK
jgi:hypothetical protein